MKLNSERKRFVSAAYLEEQPTKIDSNIQINFGQLQEKDIHNDRLGLHLKDTGDWMFTITETNQNGGITYSLEEMKETLDYMNIDLSDRDWYSHVSVGSNTMIHAHTEPANFDHPNKYLSDLNVDKLKKKLQLLPARVNGIQECVICGEGTTNNEDAYSLFGLAPLEFHKHCFYNFIATVQDILDGITPTLVSKSI